MYYRLRWLDNQQWREAIAYTKEAVDAFLDAVPAYVQVCY